MVWLTQNSSLKNNLLKTKVHLMDGTDHYNDPTYLHVSHINKDRADQKMKKKRPRNKEKSNKKEKQCGLKKQRLGVVVLLLSMCVNIILGIVLVLSIPIYGMSHKSILEVLDVSEDLSTCVCVLCSSLGINAEDGAMNGRKDVIVINMSQHSFCCLRNTGYLQTLITVFSAQFGDHEDMARNDTKPVLTVPQQIKHGAHLFLDRSYLKDDKLVWTTDFGYGCAYIGHGMAMDSGRLQIKQDGRYFLYSFFTLKTRETTNESHNALHTVTRYNPRFPELKNQLLLFSKQSLARESEKFATTYLGASLVLRKGDELWVRAEPVSAVYAFAPSNYFGLFKLDS
ncbi:uncharacterized protein LOC124125202 [Haliotis rufescens]|uniref:uncharacterized protein LOC124125202 n=1 Tax=Haliotis rufescens TaxID=6454 RepID=UPI00201EC6B1|nr:uncharacterized protein LOC124125202 [Haliotis rufescens]